MATADLDPAVKFLAKVAKGTKGIVDVDVAQRALAQMPGWSMEPVVFPYEAWQLSTSDLQAFLNDNLGPSYEAPHRELNKAETKELKTMVTDDSRLGEELLRQGHVGPEPRIVDENGVYIEKFEGPKRVAIQYHGIKMGYALGMMWLGVRGWRITAPDGASDYVHGPFRSSWKGSRARFDQGPIFDNLVGFWTFLYKHGAKDDAKKALDAMGSDVLEKSQMKKEDRERLERQRMFLPEIEALFNELTQERYEFVVKYLTLEYIADAKYYVAKQHLPYNDRPKLTRAIADMTELRKVKWSSEWEGRYDEWQQANDTRHLKSDYKEIADRHARNDAEEARRAFVWKNTDRISTIARRKGQTPKVTVIDNNEQGVAGYGGNIRFSFDDGSSFVLRNKTVWKRDQFGDRFMQWPTTFHDVKLAGGKKMSSPSEERMVDVFSVQRVANPNVSQNMMGFAAAHYQRMAQRLAQG